MASLLNPAQEPDISHACLGAPQVLTPGVLDPKEDTVQK